MATERGEYIYYAEVALVHVELMRYLGKVGDARCPSISRKLRVVYLQDFPDR